MWIARDKNGLLFIYRHEPSKDKEAWINNPQDTGLYDVRYMTEDYFPEVKWEDEEPRKIILKPIKNS